MSVEAHYTALSEIPKIHARVHEYFQSGVTRPLAYRRRQLIQLARMLQDNVVALEDAMIEDLGRERQDTTGPETAPAIQACLNAMNNLEEWTRPEKPKVEEWRGSWDTTIYHVPKGVALFILPWNHPVVITFLPLVGCIAAGCPAVLKPSEHAPASSALLASLIPQYLDTQAYVVVQGAVPQATALLDFPWGHIFFTGGIHNGRKIAAAAAKFVTPLTLELGSKSPVIVSPECDMELVAKRMLYGKLLNTGQARNIPTAQSFMLILCVQVCVAPDYALVPRSVAPAFYEGMKKAHAVCFPLDPLRPDSTWGKIVNEHHYDRLERLIKETKGKVIIGGRSDPVTRRISNTVVADVKLDDILMEDEVFGPVLAVVEVDDVDEAIRIVAARPHPLVLYAFTNEEEIKEKIRNQTNSGSLVLNDTLIQLAIYEMPFGGIGASGYGSYFGKYSFDTFTHCRGYIDVPPAVEPYFKHRYQPFTEESYKAMCAGAFVKIPDA
ncbi:uncharacterized protein PHACADRAFT_153983 [Phanerochaete carnosa HHB-10118-sp]|uniref:Aldehyde dehydrogenase n=1 Tax=Phanerochaete carnosa (strain HHB-10118-sp) TaxID=650164 RepID=K5VSK3_PHACS|nr:uncharacterized protein PHACADRAFT_153983 [Phanerochaete carnosa HHB-10118-sp]EKM49549.1 hypothetical protein PHACADRAFT_153983 [Phanerochaete carnosa HHB-10118-sp]